MPSVPEILDAASQHLQAGRLAEAAAGYGEVLRIEPRNLQALYQLGVVLLSNGQVEQAARLFAEAVQVDPRQSASHANLGECLRQLGRPAEAEQSLRRAIELEPNWTQLYSALGICLQSLGRYGEAAEALRRVVQAEPRSADALFDLGSALQMQGDLSQSSECYTAALGLDPNHLLTLVNLGTLCKHQGKLEEAVGYFQRALALQPNHTIALTNLGSTLELLGLTDEALRHHQLAVQSNPASLTAQLALGALAQKLGRLDEAEASFQTVLRGDPSSLSARHGLAAVAYHRGKYDEVWSICEQTLKVAPNDAQSHLVLAKLLNEQGRRDDAVRHHRRAIELNPKLPTAHGGLAIALHLQGEIDEAIESYRREIETNPRSSLDHSNYLYCLNFHPSMDAQSIFAEHRAWAERHADSLTAACASHTNDRTPLRRLKIGYVSPHFFGHAVNFFSEPILASHNHSDFEIYCYSDVAEEDETTRRLRGYADVWRPIRGAGHEQVSRMIRDDQIDILVDLTGHIGENRMPVFARKPAPVQVTYIGYQNTTGMRAMDYRLTDEYADPPGQTDRYYTEQLVRLPQTFFVYKPSDDAPAVGPLPASERGQVTFGSFNNFGKVNPPVLATWAEILRAVPNAHLVILADMTETVENRLRETFANHGVEAERLKLVRRLPRPEYLQLIKSVDIALDPFPFNGHTTTCDCLWQGVPVITLSGDRYVSRFGGSGLKTLGLDELIAASPEQYVEIATRLAGDLPHLAELRSSLRLMMSTSPLMDFAGFTRNLEAAYRKMWQSWCTEPRVDESKC